MDGFSGTLLETKMNQANEKKSSNKTIQKYLFAFE
jgi:hypothetical protein